MGGADPAGGWPEFPWGAEGTDYRELARYVTPDALRDTYLLDRDPVEPDWVPPDDRSRNDRWAMAARAFNQMVRGGFRYDREPFSTAKAQAIRGVHDALPPGTTTCLELALIYAALCRANDLYCLLVLVDREGGPHHAVVGLLLGLDARDEAVTPEGIIPWIGSTDPGHPGLWDGQGVTPDDLVLLDGSRTGDRLEIVDPTLACEGMGQTVDAAFNPRDASYLHEPQHRVRILDIPWLHRQKQFASYTPPRRAGIGLTNQVPRDRTYWPYPSRSGLLDELRAASGLVILHGLPGSGKSMLAREAAIRAAGGVGWLLRADDARTVGAELARAEALEQGLSIDTDATDRKELADEARSRLKGTPQRWVVVADNADAIADSDAQEAKQVDLIFDGLPEPGENQLMLVTTTSEAWEAVVARRQRAGAEARFLTLDPLGDAELAEAHPDLRPDELRLVAGLPLLADAFATFRVTTGTSPLERLGTASSVPSAGVVDHDATAALLWASAKAQVIERTLLGLDLAAVERAAYFATLLPPDHVDQALVDQLLDQPRSTDALVALGLVRPTSRDGVYFMHRLFGRVVRADLGHGGYAAGLLRWCAHPRYIEELDRYGTAAEILATGHVLEQVATGTGNASIDEALVAQALAANASLLELFGLTPSSAARYKVAQRYLNEARPSDWRWLAEARHGEHRETNQNPNATRDELVAAREAVEGVIQLRRLHADAVERGELAGDAALARAEVEASRALRWLLAARIAEKDGDSLAAEQALGELVDSAETRVGLLGTEHVLTIRGLYNVAAQRLRLAKMFADPGMADEQFDAAIQEYDRVGDLRRHYHRRADHPHVASCEHGHGVALYNKAVYGTAPDRGRSECLALLDAAYDRLNVALQMRRQVPETELAFVDLGKSWRVIGKVGRAQRCLRDHRDAAWLAESLRPDAPGLNGDDDRELRILLDRLGIIPWEGRDGTEVPT